MEILWKAMLLGIGLGLIAGIIVISYGMKLLNQAKTDRGMKLLNQAKTDRGTQLRNLRRT